MTLSTDQIPIPGPLGRRPRPWRPGVHRAGALVSALLRPAAARSVDITGALILIVLLSPLIAARSLVALVRTGRILARTPLVGRFRERFERLSFADSAPGESLPVLLNVLRGDLSFTGPRPLRPEETEGLPPAAEVRFEVRPGLVSPYAIRRRSRIAHEGEFETDREFYYSQTVKGDLALLARSVPARWIGSAQPGDAPPELDFFGIRVVNTTMDEAVQWILDRAREEGRHDLAFVNPDCLNIACRHPEYHSVLRSAERVLPDGIGLNVGCRLMGTSLLANVNGTDLFPRLCERAAAEGLPLFLLGARPGVAAAAGEEMVRRYPELRIAGSQDGYFHPDEEEAVIDRINSSGARVLLVAFGAPRQELWLASRGDRLTPPVRMGVGGLLDFYSGRIPRAPLWMREIGLEWTWRLLQEPGRMWRRYVVGNPLFLYRVWRQARRERTR